MRILFLAHRLPYPPNKGDKIRSFWELKTLSARHEIDLFCFYDDPNDKSQVANLEPYCNSVYAEPLSVLGSRARALSALARGRPFSTAYFYSKTMAARIGKAMRSRSHDLIFVFGSSMAQYAEPWPNLPRVQDLVDVDSDKWVQYSKRSRGPLSWLWKVEGKRLEKYESKVVRSFSNTLVCTDAEAKLLRSKAPVGRIEVLQNWLDMAYYRPEAIHIPENIRTLQPYVIFTGTMDYFPNVDAVLFFAHEILPAIRSRVPNLRFVIAGRNPNTQVMRLAADPKIVITGTVPDIRPYLGGAAVAVAPMRLARGVQNKILEALAMDVPVVATTTAADALPSDLSALLAAESEPRFFADRVVRNLLHAPERSGARRMSVDRYFTSLDLPSQMEQLVINATVTRSTETQVERVEMAV